MLIRGCAMVGMEPRTGQDGAPAPVQETAPQRRWRLGLVYGAMLLVLAGFGAGRLREHWPQMLTAIHATEQRSRMVAQARAEYQAALDGPGSDPHALSILPHRIDNYPPLALRRHEEGAVILQLLVQADGSVGDVSIVRSSGHEQLDAAALVGVGDWIYIPAVRDHRPVPATIQVRVAFRAGGAP